MPPPYVPSNRRPALPREEAATAPQLTAMSQREAEVRKRLAEAERVIRAELGEAVPPQHADLPPMRSEYPSAHDLANQKEIAETKLALDKVNATLAAQDKVLSELRAGQSSTQAHVEVSPKLVAAEVDKARNRGLVVAALIQPVVAVIIAAALSAYSQHKAAPPVVNVNSYPQEHAPAAPPVATHEATPATSASARGGH